MDRYYNTAIISGHTIRYYTTNNPDRFIVLTGQIDDKKMQFDMRPHIARLHAQDRTHYDTPASIRNCGCDVCNDARQQHGRAPFNFSQKNKWRHGEILPGLTAVDVTSRIEQLELTQPYR